MNTMFMKMYVKYQDLMSRDEGQDLVEYALLVALLSLIAVGTISSLGSAINTIFGNILKDI
jgi:pilus assembly protein Flp/PilA